MQHADHLVGLCLLKNFMQQARGAGRIESDEGHHGLDVGSWLWAVSGTQHLHICLSQHDNILLLLLQVSG
jgi:hypothetical protein